MCGKTRQRRRGSFGPLHTHDLMGRDVKGVSPGPTNPCGGIAVARLGSGGAEWRVGHQGPSSQPCFSESTNLEKAVPGRGSPFHHTCPPAGVQPCPAPSYLSLSLCGAWWGVGVAVHRGPAWQGWRLNLSNLSLWGPGLSALRCAAWPPLQRRWGGYPPSASPARRRPHTCVQWEGVASSDVQGGPSPPHPGSLAVP